MIDLSPSPRAADTLRALDVFIARSVPGLTRARAQRLIDDGNVAVTVALLTAV